jgi:demethylmenaquinone methyltransferase/2-methoxy-6-polyprenyl-1,4-benzoquinol methylase
MVAPILRRTAENMSEQRTTAAGGMETSYGFRNVAADDKQPLVNEVFHRVAKRYDVMNDLMSGGLHRLWKDAVVAWLNPPKRPGWRALDVAGGTGDVAFRMVEASDRNAHVTVLDINGSMLEVGRERAEKRGLAENVDFVEANAEELPFDDDSFDAYTIAFGIRNVPRIELALGEAFRVLKPGGRFLCLEFSEVDMPLLDKVYEAWSFRAIPRIGKAVTGDGEPYAYLVESIAKFPNQKNFAAMIERAGFERVSFRNYTGGIAALHSGWKL